jgi:hypothetical protein
MSLYFLREKEEPFSLLSEKKKKTCLNQNAAQLVGLSRRSYEIVINNPK